MLGHFDDINGTNESSLEHTLMLMDSGNSAGRYLFGNILVNWEVVRILGTPIIEITDVKESTSLGATNTTRSNNLLFTHLNMYFDGRHHNIDIKNPNCTYTGKLGKEVGRFKIGSTIYNNKKLPEGIVGMVVNWLWGDDSLIMGVDTMDRLKY